MGADLLLYPVPAATINTERREAITALIDAIPDDEGPDWFEEPDDFRAALHDAVDVYADCEGLRECWTARLPGWDCYYHFTGGMSWGESPTKLAEDFSAICDCNELWNLLHDFALEDVAVKSEQAASSSTA